jgi:hypothetical protein
MARKAERDQGGSGERSVSKKKKKKAIPAQGWRTPIGQQQSKRLFIFYFSSLTLESYQPLTTSSLSNPPKSPSAHSLHLSALTHNMKRKKHYELLLHSFACLSAKK